MGSIDAGLAILLGIYRDDDHTDSDYVIRKLLSLKLFDDGDKKWSKSVKEAGLEILVISQYTLCHTFKGTKPDFHHCMKGDQSRPFFFEFVDRLRKEYSADKIQTGKFGSYSNLDFNLDGPTTLVIDSPPKKTEAIEKK